MRKETQLKGCNGTTDWIIEIVSPGTERMDYGIKLFKYRSAGVRESWITNPKTRTVNVFDDDIPVCIYSDLTIRITDLF